jgi:hypothetical protein
MAEKAHAVCFNENRPKEMNTFDFALLATDKDDNAIAYATCIEIDSESVYMQHGGAFPNAKKSMKAVNAYHRFIAFLREKFKRASTRIQNINIPMLKLAFSAGFIVNGCDCHGDEIYLHLINNFRS